MSANAIIKLQRTIEALEFAVARLQRDIDDNKLERELLYVKLANLSPSYSKNIRELELASDPRFPALMARLLRVV